MIISLSHPLQNLTTKIASGLQWVMEFCPGVDHVVKVDEDTYLHLPALMHVIHMADSLGHDKYVLGHAHGRKQPKVVRVGRWAVGPEFPLGE